jgi:transcriptional/translational regulatory protein YebC/TACO1
MLASLARKHLWSASGFGTNNKLRIFNFTKRTMAGHSKWHNIRHKKGAEDAKKTALLSIIGKQLKSALEQGGNSPTNSTLQNIIEKARGLNVSREFIERSIARSMSAKSGGTTRYEGTGPCGVSFIITCITDNKARTAPMLRHVFSKFGGNLGSTNSVAFR